MTKPRSITFAEDPDVCPVTLVREDSCRHTIFHKGCKPCKRELKRREFLANASRSVYEKSKVLLSKNAPEEYNMYRNGIRLHRVRGESKIARAVDLFLDAQESCDKHRKSVKQHLN